MATIRLSLDGQVSGESLEFLRAELAKIPDTNADIQANEVVFVVDVQSNGPAAAASIASWLRRVEYSGTVALAGPYGESTIFSTKSDAMEKMISGTLAAVGEP